MKIYLASSWRNQHQPEVLQALRAAGHEVYEPVAALVPELREPELMYKCFDSPEGKTPLFRYIDALCAHLATLNGDR